jgi:polysaccharide biosynthesis/export protein
MVRKSAEARTGGKIGWAGRVGLAVFLLGGWASAAAQQKTAVPTGSALMAAKDTGASNSSPSVVNTPINDYTVSPEDLLDVNVMGVPEVTREYRVSSNGFLTLPLLSEPVPAAGETLDQLQRLIAAKYREAGMLNDAVVTVSLRETRHHTVLVSGEVARPQNLPVFGPTRLLEVLIQAGGLTLDAGSDAVIMRGEMGARADLAESAQSGLPPRGQSFTLDIRKLVQTGDDVTNVLLYPGDRVTVQRAELIYILGAVNRPGGYVLTDQRQDVTVLKALAMAGDVNGIAKKNHITILRKDPTGPEDKRNEIPVNYKAMVKGQIADMRLKPDDILYVPESRSLKAWHGSITTMGQVATAGATSLMIYR